MVNDRSISYVLTQSIDDECNDEYKRMLVCE